MEWIKLTKENHENLKEILAYNGRDFLVGYIDFRDDGVFFCEDDCQTLENVTHYCELIKPV